MQLVRNFADAVATQFPLNPAYGLITFADNATMVRSFTQCVGAGALDCLRAGLTTLRSSGNTNTLEALQKAVSVSGRFAIDRLQYFYLRLAPNPALQKWSNSIWLNI